MPSTITTKFRRPSPRRIATAALLAVLAIGILAPAAHADDNNAWDVTQTISNQSKLWGLQKVSVSSGPNGQTIGAPDNQIDPNTVAGKGGVFRQANATTSGGTRFFEVNAAYNVTYGGAPKGKLMLRTRMSCPSRIVDGKAECTEPAKIGLTEAKGTGVLLKVSETHSVDHTTAGAPTKAQETITIADRG